MSFAKRALEDLPEFAEPATEFDTVRFMAAFQPHLTPADLRQLKWEGWLDDVEVGVKLFENGYSDWNCISIEEHEGWHKAQKAAERWHRATMMTADMEQIAA